VFTSRRKSAEKEEIIEKIILEKYDSYYRMAMSYVHNEADASDIVQEGAYKAIKNSDQLKDTNFAATWIYRIMMNEIYRYAGSAKVISLDDEQFEEPSTEDHYENLDLKSALESLQPNDRAVIQLKYFEDKTLEEISYILGENVNTVKSRLYRGLKKLRVKMEDEYEKQ